MYESLTAHYAKVVAKTEKKKRATAAAAAAAATAGEGADEGGVVPHSLRLQHEEEPVVDGGDVEVDMSA